MSEMTTGMAAPNGAAFSYTVWPPGTIATLTNVRWNNDYRDIPIFPTGQAGLNAFIDAGENYNTVINGMSYARPGNPIRINIPLTKAMKYNYVRVYNPAQPIDGDDHSYWYYFITGVRHIAPNTTEINVQLDVVQSFIYNVSFGRSYVEAGHVGIANTAQFSGYGRDYLTVPEGFDLGSEYQVKRVFRRVDSDSLSSGNNYRILAMSTTNLDPDAAGDASNPSLMSAMGSRSQWLPNGAELVCFDNLTSFSSYMHSMAEKPWVTQGIIGVWAFPRVFDIPTGTDIAPGMAYVNPGRATPVTRATQSEWRSQEWTIPVRYRHLKKFLTYPYSVFELTTNTGQPVILKPEVWNNANADITALPLWTPPNPRVTYYPKDYNAGSTGEVWNGVPDGGEFLDVASTLANLPQFSVVNNGFMGFLARNNSSIAFMHEQADWSQARAMGAANVGYSNANVGMDLNAQQATINANLAGFQNNNANQQAWWNTGLGAVGNVAGGAISGGVNGALGGLGNSLVQAGHTAINNHYATQSTAASQQAIKNSSVAQNSAAEIIRDTNMDYAQFAAVGDYRTSISAINAKVQDARLTQPTVSGQMGGDQNLLANYFLGYVLRFKQIDANVMTMIGEHWLRYGYAVNRYRQFTSAQSLHVMSNFSYWKLQDCTIVAAGMPETYKQTIRGVLEKGVTVWRDPGMIGQTDPANNAPLEGVTL